MHVEHNHNTYHYQKLSSQLDQVSPECKRLHLNQKITAQMDIPNTVVTFRNIISLWKLQINGIGMKLMLFWFPTATLSLKTLAW